ncbi:MAG: anaerobic ribonucleoside-triphosphate reductase [Anaerolineae bacterium]
MSAKNSSLKPRGTGPVESEVKVPCEVYSRIVGYLRPVRNWHKGKQQEFAERKMFRLPDETGEG